MPKLTKRVVDAIWPNPGGRESFLWDSGDGALKGSGCASRRVAPPATSFTTALVRVDHAGW
jgi:hypothetical protein